MLYFYPLKLKKILISNIHVKYINLHTKNQIIYLLILGSFRTIWGLRVETIKKIPVFLLFNNVKIVIIQN